ncbi:MAG TPA: wax ester/triacylglycerol synthase domain-containing protein [Acidimicrobiales bacterium]|nr:wax ester/triacylglycerol synthase domain-containing protein [Acidimicrobiales bacterium]
MPAVMTPSEALMWSIERDPILRSNFLTVTILEEPPDFDRLVRRIDDTIQGFPRMSQRVRNPSWPWERPQWIDDASFDLHFHVRRLTLPPPGTRRDLLDAAALVLEDAFDPVRPLWQLTVVEGLEGGGAALLTKMHHTITDGVGGLRLSSSFLDFDAQGAAPVRAPKPAAPKVDAQDSAGGGAAGAEPQARPDLLEMARSAARRARPDALVRQTREGVETLSSLVRQTVGMAGSSGASFGQGARSMGRRLDTLDLGLDDARRTAKALGGTINDFFVTGVAGGAAAYQRRLGYEIERLRVAMPVSTRVDSSFGGNSFAPARVTVPVADKDPVARFRTTHDVLSAARSERALGIVDSVATLVLALPPMVLAPLARQQVSSVDLGASNLRGSPVELFMAGARVVANYPMGPTAGVAFNATVLSYMDRLDMGIAMDAAAIEEPVELNECIADEFAALVSAGRSEGG